MRPSFLLPSVFIVAALCVVWTSIVVSSSIAVRHGDGVKKHHIDDWPSPHPPQLANAVRTALRGDVQTAEERELLTGGSDDDDGGVGGDGDASSGVTRVERRKSHVASTSSATPPPQQRRQWTPPYLRWEMDHPLFVPSNWTYQTHRFCKSGLDNKAQEGRQGGRSEKKIIVHYHLQHNAGTSLWNTARRNVEGCATRACWQTSKHCLVSYNETVEAENIRHNLDVHGVEYVSYELALPPRFPLPFVSPEAREGLFFTTIVRNPFSRMLTSLRNYVVKSKKKKPKSPNGEGGQPQASNWVWSEKSPFWRSLALRSGSDGNMRHWMYDADNLNIRWLSGAQSEITRDHVNVAKCRLKLFDLVMSDKLMEVATRKVICPLNGWNTDLSLCAGPSFGAEKSKVRANKTDPLEGVDPTFVGAWIERLRPSFEIYDYARILSLKHLQRHGVPIESLPTDLSEVPSYVAAMEKYTDMTLREGHFEGSKSYLPPLVKLSNEKWYAPPEDFCEEMERIWTSNPDEVPNVVGIGCFEKPANKSSTYPKE